MTTTNPIVPRSGCDHRRGLLGRITGPVRPGVGA